MVSEPLLVLFSSAFTPNASQFPQPSHLLSFHWPDPQCLLPVARFSDLRADWWVKGETKDS